MELQGSLWYDIGINSINVYINGSPYLIRTSATNFWRKTAVSTEFGARKNGASILQYIKAITASDFK